MLVIYEKPLKEYMKKKGIQTIIIEAYTGKSWTGVPELSARFADSKTAQRTKKKNCRIIKGEIGEILILTPGMKYNDTITLHLNSFLGIKNIKVDGIKV